MLRSIKDLIGHYTIEANDGDIGEVGDLLFNDERWIMRYLVVDTGKWLPGREVLIPNLVLGDPDWKARKFPVSLTKKQIEDSPPVASDKPVSRQHEINLHEYFNWPRYWSVGMPVGSARWQGSATGERTTTGEESTEEAEEDKHADPHLRSCKELFGYHIQATDDEVGHVEDFIVDDEDWQIRYLIVDTRNWLPGRKVVVATNWIKAVSWEDRKVVVDLSREKIKGAPKFDPSAPVNRDYEEVLYDYYGRPKYWQ
jgi:uncharacterized protein YrrD